MIYEDFKWFHMISYDLAVDCSNGILYIEWYKHFGLWFQIHRSLEHLAHRSDPGLVFENISSLSDLSDDSHCQKWFGQSSSSGWWFQTFYIHNIYMGNVMIPTDFFHIFSISYMGCHPSHWLIFFKMLIAPPTRSWLTDPCLIHLNPRPLESLIFGWTFTMKTYENIWKHMKSYEIIWTN
jgi:hypothetical protein